MQTEPFALRALIFDLDGTLADTLEAIREAVNMTMEHFGYPISSYEEIRLAIGNGARRLIQRRMPAPDADDPALVSCTLADYDASYAKTYLNTRTCYRGIPEAIAALRAQGFSMAVLSNKQDAYVKGIIEQLFPAGTFDVVCGQTELPTKPDPTVPLRIIHTLGVAREDCAMIGDSDVDILTAHNAGMHAIGCAWGFRGREVLSAAGADAILESPEELTHMLVAKPAML